MPLSPTNRARGQATVASAISSLFWWRWGGTLAATFATLLLVLAAVAWFFPRGYVPVQRTLDRITGMVLTACTWLVLGLIYYGVFTPLRAWRALTRQDPLQLRKVENASSYFQPLSDTKRRFDRQF